MRTLLIGLALVAIALVALRTFVIALEPRMAFYPFRGEDVTPRSLGLSYEILTVRTIDGESLNGWLLRPDAPRGSTEILYFHGNGGNLSMWLDILAPLAREGFTVVAFDYRGYGLSSGSPTEDGLYRDIDAIVDDFWAHRHTAGGRVVYWGRSLGATMAAYATARRAPDALVLESPLYDKASLLRHYPVLRLLGVFSRYRFPTLEFLQAYRGPALVIHGRDDTIVPFVEGRRVFDALATREKTFAAIEGADHNDLHTFNPDYWNALQAFLGHP